MEEMTYIPQYIFTSAPNNFPTVVKTEFQAYFTGFALNDCVKRLIVWFWQISIWSFQIIF